MRRPLWRPSVKTMVPPARCEVNNLRQHIGRPAVVVRKPLDDRRVRELVFIRVLHPAPRDISESERYYRTEVAAMSQALDGVAADAVKFLDAAP